MSYKMFRSIGLVIGFSVAVQAATDAAGVAPVVNVDYAKFQGAQNSTLGINYYYGLRFAAPPNGTLRWQAPQDIDGSAYYTKGQVYNVSTHGPECYQGFPGWFGFEGALTGQSEDCLLLDVVVPTKPKNNKLPVIVQIHGGGYTVGNSQSYPGENIVSYSDGNIVWVDIQYRLGAFGFLNSNEIQENGVANTGLLDQRSALNWVQRHISKFGGDPAKVTIWGGSAGGGSVMNQMILYGGQANPPFRAGIAEYPWWQNYHNETILEAQYTEMLALTNCTSLACLRAVPATTLATANEQSFVTGYSSGYYGYGDWYYGPSVDGSIIRDLPSNEFKQGHFSNVALLVDRDGFEGFVFTNHSINLSAENTPDLQQLFPYAKPSFFARLYELYPLSSFTGSYFSNPLVQYLTSSTPAIANDPAFWQLQEVFGDYIIDCPTYYMATAVSDAGNPVYKLVFNAGSELHGATVPFLFGANAASVNATLSEVMKDWFLSFAIDLDPNSVTFEAGKDVVRPYWPMYTAAISSASSAVTSFEVMEVNATSIDIRPDPDASDKCDFFHAQSYVVRN